MRNKSILYIEDESEQLALVKQLLERFVPDVIVDTCCTTEGAQLFLNQRCYDLIISDVMLPGEMGTTIAEKILARDPDQPIYLMSEYTGATFQDAAHRIGLELHRKFSSKDPDEFIADVRELLAKRPCEARAEIGNSAEGDDRTVGTSTADVPLGSGIGESADTSGGNGENDDSTRQTVTRRSENRKPLQFTSPHVKALRMSLGIL